jgi:ATP-dependent RNA helicase DHX29
MIETDRRFATTMLSVDLDPAYVAKIIELVETSSDDDRKSCFFHHVLLAYRFAVDKAFQERSDEKVLSKLGITYGTLRRLGFTEVRINECLQAIRGVSLDEGLEWVSSTYFSPSDLNSDIA